MAAIAGFPAAQRICDSKGEKMVGYNYSKRTTISEFTGYAERLTKL